jgi:hypothetical protein
MNMVELKWLKFESARKNPVSRWPLSFYPRMAAMRAGQRQ